VLLLLMKHLKKLALTVVIAGLTVGAVAAQTGGSDTTSTAAPSASNSNSRADDQRGFDYGWLGLLGLAGLLGLRRRDDRHDQMGSTRT
jgi:MYXO-CTERM domain-containing protein